MEGSVKWIIAIVIIALLVLFVLPAIAKLFSQPRIYETSTEIEATSEQTAELSGGSTSIIEQTVENFRAPAKSNYMSDLTSRTWNALITTYDVPGAVSKYNQVSGDAVFTRENGESLVLTLDWMTDSQTYDFTNWKLSSSLDGFIMDYDDANSGYILYAAIEKRSNSRYDVTIYDEENNIKRLIVVTS